MADAKFEIGQLVDLLTSGKVTSGLRVNWRRHHVFDDDLGGGWSYAVSSIDEMWQVTEDHLRAHDAITRLGDLAPVEGRTRP